MHFNESPTAREKYGGKITSSARISGPAVVSERGQQTNGGTGKVNGFLQRIGEAIAALHGQDEGLHLFSIRPSRTVYLLAYAVELMVYAARQLFLPIHETAFGLPGKTVVYVAHMLASLLVMLLWSPRFRRLLVASVAVMVAGFLLLVFVPAGSMLHLVSGVVAMAGLGGAVTCARCGFAFAANNAERMVGMLLMTTSVAILYLFDLVEQPGVLLTHVLPLALVALLAYCLLCFREEDLEAKEVSDAEDARGLYCALAFMIVYFGVDGYLYKLLDPRSVAGNVLFSVGMLVAVAAFFTVLVVWRLNVWHLWTLFFAFATLAAVLAILAPQLGTVLPYHLFGGMAILGWPLSLYMLACAQRRFASYRLLKRCTVIFILLSPITTISDDLIKAYRPDVIPTAALIFILAALLLFLLTVPYTYRHLFSVGWIRDLSRDDMARYQTAVEKADRFGGYDLTPRQKEVTVLLLSGMTRRQIAGELGVSESTVKMHTSELYRKLNINSRVELFRIFGPADASDKTE